MTAAQPEILVTGPVRSLEVRWILPGRLEAAVTGWFARFPAEVESREDTYLVDPQLSGLSVKLRQGTALEVKVYQGSPGVLEVTGPARGRLESWDKWSFPFGPLGQGSADLPGWRPVRKLIRRFGRPAGKARRAARRRGARSSSPRSGCATSRGGPWGSKRPARPACCAGTWRPPPRTCSPRPCPAAWNWAPMTPSPTRNGSPAGRSPPAERQRSK
jgi:hypothetical protein